MKDAIKQYDVDELLKETFHKNENSSECKLLKSTHRIDDLYRALYSSTVNFKDKSSILNALKCSISSVRHYAAVFARYSITSIDNERLGLILILINEYTHCGEELLGENPSQESNAYVKLLLEVLNLLISHVTCPIEAFEYIFSLFKPYLYKTTLSSEVKPLTTKRFLYYFTLLSIIYGVKVIKENPYHYFYLSGEGEILIQNEEERPKQYILSFDKNFALFVWLKISINSKEVEAFFPALERGIIEIEQENGFKVVVSVDKKNCLHLSTDPKVSIQLKENVWYSLAFATKPNAKGIEVELYMNQEQVSSQKIKMIKNSMKGISLFRNHLGEVSSILMSEGTHYRELFKVLNEKGLLYGVKTEKNFIVLTKSMNNTAYANYQSDFIQEIGYFILDKASNSEIKLIYMPSRYEQENKTTISLKDSTKSAKILMKQLDMNGVCNHLRYYKNLSLVNGLYNLLPLAEIMRVSNQSTYPLLTNILTNEIIDEYSMLLMSIKGNLSKVKSLKEPIYFFQFFSLFLEKLPSSCFTFNVYNYLRTLLVSEDITITKHGQQKSLINEIIVRILLNEKIIFKFDLEIQEKIWQTLDIYYTNTKIGSSFDMLKIASMLLEMDKERYTKFCCVEHASAFDNADLTKVYDIRTKFKAIAKVIQIILKQKPEDIVIFYSLLTKEISPCLQLFIVNWLSSFLIDRKIRLELNEKLIYEKLMKDNFLIETTLFALSVASFDVRVEIMLLIKLISTWDSKILFNFQQISFIQTHLIPANIVLEKERKKEIEVPEAEEVDAKIKDVASSKQMKYQETKKQIANEGKESLIEGEDKKGVCEVKEMKEEEAVEKKPIEQPQLFHETKQIEKSNKDEEPMQEEKKEINQVREPSPSKEEDLKGMIKVKKTIEKQIEEEAKASSPPKESKKKVGYEIITLTENQDYLSRYLNKDKFELFCGRMFVDLISWLTDSNLSSLVIHCLIKICPYCDLSSNSSFIEILYTSLEDYYDIINKCKPFYNWLIETAFQAFIQDAKLKGELKSASYKNDNEHRIDLKTLLDNSIKIHTQLCMRNIYKLDYFLQWCYFYKELLKEDESYSQRLDLFICLVLDDLSQEVTATVVDLDESNNDLHKTFLYFFSIVFEYLIIYKIGTNFSKEKPSNDKCLINIPEYYSTIFSQSSEDSGKHIYKRWSNYTLCKIICDKCFMIWRDKFSIGKGSNLVKTFLNNSNAFINQLSILTMDNWGSTECIANKGIPLISIISNVIATIISEIESDSDLKVWLPNYKEFLCFIIVSSANVDQSDPKYKHIQNLVKEALAFGLSFLIHQLDQKKGDLHSAIFKTIKELFNLIFLFTKQIRLDEEEEAKSDKNYGKLKVGKKQGAKTDCAVYELFNSITRIFGESILNNILASDKELIEKFSEESFKQSLTENPTLWLVVDHLFIYNKLFSMRKDTIDLVIPIFPNYCLSTSREDSMTVLDRNYVDSTYLTMKKYIIKSINGHRSRFNSQYELYIRKNKFEKLQLERKYRKIKHKQFLFRGFWSQKELFYEKREKLKYRILDHMTSDYSKPLIYPIIDYDFYLPDFSHFLKKNLFIDKENPQNLIDMDIYKFIDKEEEEKVMEKNSLNILKLMHNGAFKGITDENEADKKVKGKSKDERYFIDFIQSQMIISPEQVNKNIKTEPIPCCIVKLAYHIKGYIFNDSKRIGFFAYNWENDKANLFDNERHTCFGSIFKVQIKKKEDYFISIPYNKIERILKRKYLFKQNSMEVFSINRKSFYFCFSSQDKRDQMLFNITRSITSENIVIDYRQFSKDVGFDNTSNELIISKDLGSNSNGIMKKYEQWMNWEISTLEMLMYTNLIGNRSFCDAIQYPVFPWIVTDYSSDDWNKLAIRDFSKPMGMLEVFPESITRKDNYIHHYKFMLGDIQRKDETPYVYGTNYSNSMYIAYYLMRLFPFAQIKLELQGNSFDNPNRLFNSIKSSFYCAASQKGDVRELVPEFYYLPEMFDNINSFDFGEIDSEDKTRKERIQSVRLPPWSQKNSYKFVEVLRRKLESSEVSSEISSWLDIIFGVQQKGAKAEEIFNLFNEETYENYEEKFNKLKRKDQEYVCRLLEFGVVPHQLFSMKLAKRKTIEEICPVVPLASCAFNISHRKIFIIGKEKKKYAYSYIKSINNDERIILVSVNSISILKLSEKTDDSTKKPFYSYEQISSFSIKEDKTKIYFCFPWGKIPIVSYNKGDCVIVGGYINGQILVQSSNPKEIKVKFYIQKDLNPVSIMHIDNNEKFLFCGTKSGLVHIYFISQKESPIDLVLFKTVYDHRDSISAIHFNNRLNVFATVSADGFVMLYTMPHCKLFNLFKLPARALIEHIFVSSSPIPSIVYFNREDLTWNSYSINGKQLSQSKSPEQVGIAKLFTDSYFLDYVIYSTESQAIILMEVPTLIQVKYEKNYFKNCIDFDVTNDKRSLIALDVAEGEALKIAIIKHKAD